MTALQSIIKEAKSLKKQYPKRYAKWTDYVKQASAIYASKHKGKSPVGKKRNVGAAKPVSKHKDTKSHNVNIRVVSGIKNKNLGYLIFLSSLVVFCSSCVSSSKPITTPFPSLISFIV